MDNNQNSGKLIITRLKNFVISMILDDKGRAVQINAHDDSNISNVGNIYTGRVDKIIPSLNAAFIEFIPGKMGYLRIKNGLKPASLRQGDYLTVQVQRDAIKEKLPALTCDISIAGKMSVLTSYQKGLCFSGKLNDHDQIKLLKKEFPELNINDVGYIVRTNAFGKNNDQIFDEMRLLHDIWTDIRESMNRSRQISQIYKVPSPYIQDVRDAYDSGIGAIITDDTDIYYELYEYLEKYCPRDIEKLAIHNPKGLSLHAAYNIKKQLSEALSGKIWLRSGGSVIIEPTQALTAIDVNTGKYISGREPEKEYLKINQEAAAEIARQIRLRNLSGIIIIDFINMESVQNKKLLLDYLENQLKSDPIKTNIIEMTKLDLVELTREKIHQPLYELLDISLLQ